MDAEAYLQKQGWIKGQALKSGGIKHPLMVKHRKDTKGLGYNPLANEGWWERVFDGHIKSLDVTKGSEIKFSQDEEKLRQTTSVLYTRFKSGGVLAGTIETSVKSEVLEPKKSRGDSKKSNKRSKPDSESTESKASSSHKAKKADKKLRKSANKLLKAEKAPKKLRKLGESKNKLSKTEKNRETPF